MDSGPESLLSPDALDVFRDGRGRGQGTMPGNDLRLTQLRAQRDLEGPNAKHDIYIYTRPWPSAVVGL